LEWGSYYQDTKTGQVIRYCPLHPGQQAIMDSPARFNLFIVGKGGGKSSFAPIWLEREIRKKPLGKFIICADSYNRLEQGILPEWFKAMEYSDLKGEWKQAKHIYHLSTGGLVFVRSLDDPESINAIHASAIVCDECLILPRHAWDIIESRVMNQLGKVLVTSTPYKGKRWVVEYIDRFKAGDPAYFFYQGGSVVNPANSPEELERLRRTLPSWKYRQDYLGEFSVPEGVIYPTLRDCLTDPEPLPDGRLFGGIDIGHGAAPSAAVAGVLDQDNILHVFFELYHRPIGQESSYLSFAKGLKQWHNDFVEMTGRAVERWFADSATDTWKAFRRYRLGNDDFGPGLNTKPAKKGSGSREYGIDLVTARIQTGKLRLLKGAVVAMLQEADEYRYDVSEDDQSSNVIKGADHALDALRYLVMSIDRKR
jgi:PBSX family phage terminase large subunit